MRSSLQTELEKVTREKAEVEREKADLEREKAEMEIEKAELENRLIAREMKLKVKEEELDQSKKEAEMYQKSINQLAKEKFKVEEELIESKKGKSELKVGMGKGTENLEVEFKKSEEKRRNLKKTYLLSKVLFVYMCTLHTFVSYYTVIVCTGTTCTYYTQCTTYYVYSE